MKAVLRRLPRTLLPVFLGLGLAHLACAQPAIPESRLAADDPETLDRFGSAIAIEGTHVLVGAFLEDASGDASGSAYAYERVAGVWSAPQKLVPADGAAFDLFGNACAISGDFAAVGAFGAECVYVFHFDLIDGWVEDAKLQADDGAAGDFFGHAVAIDGDRILVGAYGADLAGTHSGSAYVFRRAGDGSWSQEAKLLPSAAAAHDNFGWRVAIDGASALVASGSRGLGGSGSVAAGEVHVFVPDLENHWNEQAVLRADDAAAGDSFGSALALEGDSAVVGAQGAMPAGASSGAAYVFTREGDGTWSQTQKLVGANAAGGDQFGAALALEGDWIAIGAYGADGPEAASQGLVEAFRRGGDGQWTSTVVLSASDGQSVVGFGQTVAMSGGRVAVGAPFLDQNPVPEAGGAYVFDLSRFGERPVAAAGEDVALADADGDGSESALLDGSASSDPSGTIVAWQWSWNDGSPQTALGETASADFPLGTTLVTLTVTNDLGATDSDTLAVTIFDPDTDNDGLEDAFEQLIIDANPDDGIEGLDDVAPDGDFDGDGATNEEEADRGSSPIAFEYPSTVIYPSGAAESESIQHGLVFDGGTVVTGSWWDDYTSGSAFVYTRDEFGTLTQEAKINPSPLRTSDAFTTSLALSGDTLLVGAPWDYRSADSQGTVYVFNRDGQGQWTQKEKLWVNALPREAFGWAMAIHGNTALITTAGGPSPHTYEFTQDAGGHWTQAANPLTPSDGAEWFGRAVALGDGIAAISGYYADDTPGKVYLYERVDGSWVEKRILTASDASPNDYFGSSLALEGNRLVVTALGVGDYAGRVYVFERGVDGTWSEVAKLAPASTAAGDVFGFSLALDGDRLLIGATQSPTPHGSGSAFLFVRDANGHWTEMPRLEPTEAAGGTYFGDGVALDGDHALVETYVPINGAIYDFDLSGLAAAGPVADAGPDLVAIDSDDSGDESVTLDAGFSRDPVGIIETWTWSWLDGGSPQGASGESPSAVFPLGETLVTLTVEDNFGRTATDTVRISVRPALSAPPTFAALPSAAADPVQTTSTILTALGADDGGEPALTYTWAAVAGPANALVDFSPNGSHAAQATTATFTQAGAYTLAVTVTDADGQTATEALPLTVQATTVGLRIEPAQPILEFGDYRLFTAFAVDQFGVETEGAARPDVLWSVDGGGTMNAWAGGFFADHPPAGTFTVSAQSGALTGETSVEVRLGPTQVFLAPLPAVIEVAAGADLSQAASAYGRGDLTFAWFEGESGQTAQPLSSAHTVTAPAPGSEHLASDTLELAAIGADTAVWLRVTDDQGHTAASPTLWISVEAGGSAAAATYAAWRDIHGLLGPNAGPEASWAHDGISNLFKYALDLDPLVPLADPSAPGLPRFDLEEGDLGPVLVCRYRRPQARSDIGFWVEFSSGLETWDFAFDQWDPAAVAEPGFEPRYAPVPVPLDGAPLFLRFRVEPY